MDFGKPKVYGDTFISDGLVVSNKVKNGAKTAKIVPKRATDRLKGARNSVFGPKNSLFFAKTI